MTRAEEGRKALRKYCKYILFLNLVESSPQDSKIFVEEKGRKTARAKGGG